MTMYGTIPFRRSAVNGRVGTRSLGKPSASFPGAIASDTHLAIAVDRLQTNLAAPLSAIATVMTVVDASAITANVLLSIDNEIVQTTSAPVGAQVSITRGFDGTTPAQHSASALVSGFVDAWHHNTLVAEVQAIETALGPNLTYLSGGNSYMADSHNFTPQTAGGRSLSVGNNALTLSPIPQTLMVNDYLCIQGGVGTSEPAQITGWNPATGQVIINCAYPHTGAWTISSASCGIQEAINTANAASGGTVILNPGISAVCGTINLRSGVHLQGYGLYNTIIRKTGDYGHTFSAVQQNGISFRWVTIQQYVNYTPGTPGSAINMPTHGAHVYLAGCNSVGFQFCRFEAAYRNVHIYGGVDIAFYSCQFYGIWDNRAGSPKITQANVFTESDNVMGIPTYIGFYGCNMVGASNGTTNTVSNYNGVGPAYGYYFTGCEDLEIIGGSMGGCNLNNVLIQPISTTIVLSNIRFTAVKFDSAGVADLCITTGTTNKNANAVTISNCIFDGELAGANGLYVAAASSGVPIVNSLTVNNCIFFAYNYAPVRIEDGAGLNINNNFIYAYNYAQSTNSVVNCGIYMGGRATKYVISDNVIGGGLSFEDYNGTSNFCTNGIVSSSSLGINNNRTPSPNSIQNLSDLVHSRYTESCTWATQPNSPAQGAYVFMTNANVNTWGTAITGAGSFPVFAIYNGTNWTVAGK